MRWRSERLAARAGLSSQEIRSAEERLGVRFPTDLTRYLSLANGLEGTDRGGFSFWPAHEFRFDDDLPSGYLGFADFLISSVEFAIRVSDAGDCDVVAVQGTVAKYVAGSFSEFVSLYLDDSLVLIE